MRNVHEACTQGQAQRERLNISLSGGRCCRCYLISSSSFILVLFLALASADLAGPYELPGRWHALPSQYLVCACVKSLSCVQLFATPWTVALQAPVSMGFSRQEYWSGLPCPLPGDLPDQGLKSGFPHCRQILYHLSHQGSPRILEQVAYPFSR